MSKVYFSDYAILKDNMLTKNTKLFIEKDTQFNGLTNDNISEFIRNKQNKYKPYKKESNYKTLIKQPQYEKIDVNKYNPYTEPFRGELKTLDPIYPSTKLYNGIVYKSSGGTYGVNSGYTNYRVY